MSNKDFIELVDHDADYDAETGDRIPLENTEEDDGELEQIEFGDDQDETPVPATNNKVVLPLHERHPLEFTVILIGATALAFNAGFVNGCTLQFRKIAVSHVTGATTQAGLAVGRNDWNKFAIDMAIILSFVFGSSITGFYMPQDSFQLGREYGPLFIIGSFLFAIACTTSFFWPSSNYYFYFAAMSCGLQNALTSKYSGNIIRTTHVTGTATDVGLVLGRFASSGDTKELWKLKVLGPIYIGYLMGGAISIPAFHHLGKLSLVVNVVVFASIGIAYSYVVGKQLHIPFWQALFGLYTRVETGVLKGGAKIKAVAVAAKKKIDVIRKQRNALPLQKPTASPLHSGDQE